MGAIFGLNLPSVLGSSALWVLLVCLGTGPGNAGEKNDVPLPEEVFPLLEQILRDSVEMSWRMIEEELRLEEARGEADVFAAAKYPSVAGNLRYLGRIEERDDFDGTRSFYQPQAALTLRQPLYHWGALQANDRIGRLRIAMAEENRSKAYRLLALAIRADFLQFALDRKAMDLAERQLDLAQRKMSVAERRFEGNEITRDQMKETQLAAEAAVLELERLRREHARAMQAFFRLTGFNPLGTEWVPSAIPVFLPSGEAEPVEPAIRPWEQLSHLRIRQAEEQLAIESVRMRPRIDLIAGVAQDQVAVFDRADIDRTVYFAGIELTWNLFDGHETRGRRAAALARKRLENRRHERQEVEMTAELERLQDSLDWAVRERMLSEDRLELAAKNLSQKEKELEQGLISEAEMAEVRVIFAERELSANRRRAASLMAMAELRSAGGVDPAMDFYLSRPR